MGGTERQFMCQLCASMVSLEKDAKLVYYLSELTVVALMHRADEKSWPWASTVQLIPDMRGCYLCRDKFSPPF